MNTAHAPRHVTKKISHASCSQENYFFDSKDIFYPPDILLNDASRKRPPMCRRVYNFPAPPLRSGERCECRLSIVVPPCAQ
eukprot:80755-Prorocentrum_minimum.AAC.1